MSDQVQDFPSKRRAEMMGATQEEYQSWLTRLNDTSKVLDDITRKIFKVVPPAARDLCKGYAIDRYMTPAPDSNAHAKLRESYEPSLARALEDNDTAYEKRPEAVKVDAHIFLDQVDQIIESARHKSVPAR